MRKLGCFIGVIGCILVASVSQAALSVHYQFVGNGNWSLDGVGSNNSKGSIGELRAIVPPGSTIVKAYLYCTRTPSASTTKPTIQFDGTTYGPGAWTALGINVSGSGLQAFRADVTAQVDETIGSGSSGTNTFSVESEDLNTQTDGEALAIVYSNEGELERTIAFIDGFSESAGDSATFHFADPLVIGPSFEALLSVGIGFSFQTGGAQQFSVIDIDGKRLTTSAGGEDDGIAENGGLITIGGIGDDPANPADPFATPSNPRSDDELYNLAPPIKTVKQGNQSAFNGLQAGQTSFTVDTLNPSANDNIFFMGLNVTAKGSVSGGTGTCPTATDLLNSVDGLGLSKSQTKRLEREVAIIKKAIDRRYAYGARRECEVLGKYVGALVRLGTLSPGAASSVEACCDSLASTIGAGSGSGGGGGNEDKRK